ncbi:hypothetical protein PINS_up005428 [Pythium insidiosum]|nr:hypothetical protein PINS_up005428 [Pythium insidiosum]
MLSVLCLVGEYLFELRPYSRFRRKIQGFQQVELTRLDGSSDADSDDDAAYPLSPTEKAASLDAGQDPAASA